MADTDNVFAGSVPKLYEMHLVPLIFEPIERDIKVAGFQRPPQIVTVAARSRAHSARIPAIAYCQGTPLRNEIEARDASRLTEATDAAAEAIAQRFGTGVVDGKIQAHVVIVDA